MIKLVTLNFILLNEIIVTVLGDCGEFFVNKFNLNIVALDLFNNSISRATCSSFRTAHLLALFLGFFVSIRVNFLSKLDCQIKS